MTLSSELWEQVRQRAKSACEYCGVTETDSGGLLSVDHFQPQAYGGTDDPENLLYCCHRCNLYKADYWPIQPDDFHLWNPRREPAEAHFAYLANGKLHPITPKGAFTLNRLRLNRLPLIMNRQRRQAHAAELRLLATYQEVVTLLEQAYHQQTLLLEEQRTLLEKQLTMIRLLLRGKG